MYTTRASFLAALFLAILAMSPTSASAKFVSNNGKTSGPLQLRVGTAPIFTLTSHGEDQITVKCETIANGVWKIRKSELAQSEVLEGGRENLSGQFSKCIAAIAGETKILIVNNTCEVQIEQDGSTTFTAGVTSNCSVTAGGCVITVAATAANKGLSQVSVLAVETKNDEIRSNITGFTAAPNEKCKNLGVTSTTGVYLSTLIAHEQKIE